MKCLVSGGAGFIGSNLAKKLIELDNTVVIIDNLSTGKEENIPDVNSLYIRDITNTKKMIDICSCHNFDIIYHVAAVPRVQFSIKEPLKTNEANILGTLSLLIAAQQTGVKRFIYSASSSAYGEQDTLPLVEYMRPNPMSPYAVQKLAGEHYCKTFFLVHGMETISLRYFNVFGTAQDPHSYYSCLIPKFFNLMMKNEQAIIFGDGEQSRDFTTVEDVVMANILAGETSNKEAFGNVFNIGGGKSYTVNEVSKKIEKLTGTKVTAIHGDPVIEAKHTSADISLAKKVLGWEPKIDFDTGLKLTFDDIFKKNVK